MQDKPSIFRKEAREYYLHLRRQEGDLPRLPSEGMQWMYWVLAAMMVVSALFCAVATVPEYVSGPAWIRPVSSAESVSALPARVPSSLDMPSTTREEPVAMYVVEALLPSSGRACLRPGMLMWVELDGARHESLMLLIESVDEQAISPSEFSRHLEPGMAETVRLKEPGVLVRARIAPRDSTLQRPVLRHSEGMLARVEVAIRTKPILFALIQQLKEPRSHDR